MEGDVFTRPVLRQRITDEDLAPGRAAVSVPDWLSEYQWVDVYPVPDGGFVCIMGPGNAGQSEPCWGKAVPDDEGYLDSGAAPWPTTAEAVAGVLDPYGAAEYSGPENWYVRHWEDIEDFDRLYHAIPFKVRRKHFIA